MQSTEKISILEQFYIACTKPRQYKKLLNVKKWKVAIFTLLMGLVITPVSYTHLTLPTTPYV